MLYFTVEGAVFNAWCARNLPAPRGDQIGRTSRFHGMVVAIPSLLDSELMAWINRRAFLAGDLGDAFVPDKTLARTHFYERASERLTAPRLRPQVHWRRVAYISRAAGAPPWADRLCYAT